MAKTGIKIPPNFIAFDRKVIVFDKQGIPWVINPELDSISLAVITMPGDKQSAVVKKKRK